MEFNFRSGIEIGSLSAENDRALMEVFIDKDEMKLLGDVENHKSIITGRTGSGKSALIKYIEENEKNVCRINPEAMSLVYLSDSTILNHFRELGINLDLFYKLLWKHVFIVELLKMYFGENPFKDSNFFANLISKARSKEEKRAYEYLKNWELDFWTKTEYRIKEITKKIKDNYATSLGISSDQLDAKLSTGKLFEEHEKIEVLNKAQQVVSQSQIDEILKVTKIMEDEIFNNVQRKYFIVIDDLDKEWVEKSIAYDLIKCLLQTINELRRLTGVKIIIALRTNIYEKIVNKNLSKGFQREKYNDMLINISWTKNELRELINSRLNYLFKYKYTSKSPTIEDIFPIATHSPV